MSTANQGPRYKNPKNFACARHKIFLPLFTT